MIVQVGRFLLAARYRRQVDWFRAAEQGQKTGCPSTVFAEIAIVQPILSGDPELEAALRSNTLNLAGQSNACNSGPRLVWLIDEGDDAATDITQRLHAEFGEARIQIIRCPAAPLDTNPKSFKLDYFCRRAELDIVLVLDDDTRLSNYGFRRLMEQMSRADLACGLPVYHCTGNFWSRLVADFVNSQSFLTYVPPLNFGPPISINGMCYAVRLDRLQEAGGFSAIQDRLCDDYALRQLGGRHGWQIVQGLQTQFLRTTVAGPLAYFQLMHRWMLFTLLLLKDQPPVRRLWLSAMLALPNILLWMTLLCTVVGLALASGELALKKGWAVTQLVFGPLLIVTLAVFRRTIWRMSSDRIADWEQPTGPNSPAEASGILNSPQAPSHLGSLIAEFLLPVHSLMAIFNRRIRWRKHTILVKDDGRFDIETE